MSAITAAEQLMLELTNRARLDPLGEAAMFGINLNDGLAEGTISSAPKQVLTHNQFLEHAALDHSTWMLDADVFAHTGEGGSTATARVQSAGYALSGSWSVGENISWTGTTGALDLEAAILIQHESLFRSAGHRVNTLNGFFREIGIAQVEGKFLHDGVNYNASMLTLDFGKTGTTSFLTGVTYEDHDGDAFYDVGEGRGGVTISVGAAGTVSQVAGGYGLAIEASGTVGVVISFGSSEINADVDMSRGNVKLDLVGNNLLLSSSSINLGSGGLDLSLIGIENIAGHGNSVRNVITGNAGANAISGQGGSDVLNASDGDDAVSGGSGHDRISGEGGNDRLYGGAGHDVLKGGSGNDRILGGSGVDRATFSGSAAVTVDLSVTVGQLTGHGKDTLVGIENIGAAAGDDRLTGNATENALYGNAGSDRLAGAAGADKLSGGTGADTFVFGNGDGVDRILDFSRSDGDRVELDDAIWGGGKTVDQVISEFGQISSSGFTLAFDSGDSLFFKAMKNPAALIGCIEIL